jgi:hypothetical protein
MSGPVVRALTCPYITDCDCYCNITGVFFKFGVEVGVELNCELPIQVTDHGSAV